jgi:putative transposase
MPRRPPINPCGVYHVGSRGCYGQTLYRDHRQHELFLFLYNRAAVKYGWTTLTWALMGNHHHFIIELAQGGLSEGMRELHSMYSRRIHLIYGMTGQGHLVRHAFFARELKSTAEILVGCRYVDLNAVASRPEIDPAGAAWSGYRAIVGLEHPRSFHSPSRVLELISPRPTAAVAAYRQFVDDGRVLLSHASSPNNVVESGS